MIDFFNSGGLFMWPILICALLVLGLAARTGVALARSEGPPRAEVGSNLDAVLFWGAFGAVVGVLGTLGGIAQMASAIARVEAVQPSTVWAGIRVTLVTSIGGLATLLVALLLWILLRAVRRSSLPA